MELASSVVASSQSLSECVACIRLADSGAAQGAPSSYGVFLSGRSSGHGKSCAWRVPGVDQVYGAVNSSSCRSREICQPSRERSNGGLRRSCKLGQESVPERLMQVADVTGPSVCSLRVDSRSGYLHSDMCSQTGSLKGFFGGEGGFSKWSREKSRRGDAFLVGSWDEGVSVGLCHLVQSSVQRNSRAADDGHAKQEEPVRTDGSCGYIGGTSYATAGSVGCVLRRSTVCCHLPGPPKCFASISGKNGMMNRRSSSRNEARRKLPVSAAQSDVGSSYSELSSEVQATVSYQVQDGDTLTSIAKKYDTSVQLLAQVNNIGDVNLLLTGQHLIMPAETKAYQRIRGPTVDLDEFPIPRGYDMRASSLRVVYQQGSSSNAGGQETSSRSSTQDSKNQYIAASVLPSLGPSLAKFTVPMLLIAPLLGFCIRCIVDALYVHMDQEQVKRQAEWEAYNVSHMPKAKRWQRILDEDRDSDAEEGPNSMNSWPTDNIWSSEVSGVMDPSVREKTREILSMEAEEDVVLREKEDYEDMRKSYAELESSYMKFLVDSGLSKSGYWRGGVPTTSAAHDGDPR